MLKLCRRCNTPNDPGGRYCHACGETLRPLCALCDYANSEAAIFCGGCGCRLSNNSNDRNPGADEDPGAANAALSPPLAALLRSRFAREGERKHVTVMFADMRGSTELIADLDPEQAMQRLEPGVQAMAKAVRQFGGTLNRVHGDGIMALFGAPRAYEDHAVRACFAARAMMDAVERLDDAGLAIRIGLNSGEVVVRSIGLDLAIEYDAHGRTTHLASRLEQLATPGTICISGDTARLAAGFVETSARGAIEIRGFAQPVAVFELTGVVGRSRWQVRATAHNLSPFVGRETEMHLLSDAWRQARRGRGQVVSVAGGAGIGKSRLVHEFLQHADVEYVRSVRVAAPTHGAQTPYQLLVELLRGLLGVDSQDAKTTVEARLHDLAETMAADPTTVVAPLRVLLDLPVTDPGWAEMDAARRRQVTHDAVCRLVGHLQQAAPLILVIEDMHWSDQASQSALEEIVADLATTRLMIVLTARRDYRHRWIGQSNHTLIQLRPLDDEASDALLRGLLGDAANLEPLRRHLAEQTDGIPLFLEEVSHALIETGVLVDERTRFRLTISAADVQVPDSVQAVLAARIDRLPADERMLLQIAAVIGTNVSVPLLQRVAGIPADELARQLLALRAAEFLTEVHGSYRTAYAFKHALTHVVAYESMLARHRRALHADVLAAMTALFPDRLDELTEQMAEHAERGEVWDQALALTTRAAQRAIDRSAHRASTAFFERALVALGRLPAGPETTRQAIAIRMGLRVTLSATGDLEHVRSYLQEAEHLAGSIGDDALLASIVISRAVILNNLGDLEGAAQAGLRGQTLAKAQQSVPATINAGYALGQTYWNRGTFVEAEAILTSAATMATRPFRAQASGTTGTASVLCLVSLSHTLAFVGRVSEALTRSQEALAIAQGTARPYDMAYSEAACGLVYLTTGALDQATVNLEAALRIARESEIVLLMPHAARYLGRAYALSGRTVEAIELLREMTSLAAAKSLEPLQSWCSAALGLALALDGDVNGAEARLTQVRRFAATQGYRPLEVHAHRLLAIVGGLNRTGSDIPHESHAYLRAGIRMARELGMLPELGHCHHALAQLHLRAGDAALGQLELAKSREIYYNNGMAGCVSALDATPNDNEQQKLLSKTFRVLG